MKVLVLSDSTWELAKRKLQAELDCSQTDILFAKAWERFNRCKWDGMKFLRKRHIEAIKLNREIQ